jgi:hypothetical protein
VGGIDLGRHTILPKADISGMTGASRGNSRLACLVLGQQRSVALFVRVAHPREVAKAEGKARSCGPRMSHFFISLPFTATEDLKIHRVR